MTEREKLLARAEELFPGTGIAGDYANSPDVEIATMVRYAEQAKRDEKHDGHLGAVWAADSRSAGGDTSAG